MTAAASKPLNESIMTQIFSSFVDNNPFSGSQAGDLVLTAVLQKVGPWFSRTK